MHTRIRAEIHAYTHTHARARTHTHTQPARAHLAVTSRSSPAALSTPGSATRTTSVSQLALPGSFAMGSSAMP